ncbi:MAG: hypothetical protein ACT4OF_14275 [Caulobacteraceae bacterium]
MIDGATLYMLILGAIFVPAGAVAVYFTHRERLRDEAEEASRDAHETAAE